MGFAIPKIEYKKSTLTSTTNIGTATIEVATADLAEGMFVRGPGIPAGAKIISVGSGVVDFDGLAESTEAGEDFEYGFMVEFDFPPVEPKGEIIETKANTSESLSGIRQVSINNREATRQPTFSFVSPTIFVKLDAFMREWALLGYEFDYYDDKTSIYFKTFELDKLKYEPQKLAPKGLDVYVWQVPLTFRRVL